MNTPKKLKRHIWIFFRFLIFYCFITCILQLGEQFDFWLYPVLIDWGLNAVYILVATWFIWRGYTGMVRDGDFYDECIF